VHGVAARERVNALLDRLQAQAWSAGVSARNKVRYPDHRK